MKPPLPLDRFGDEARDLSGRRGLDHVLDVLGAFDFTRRVRQPERTAVAVGVVGMDHATAAGAVLPRQMPCPANVVPSAVRPW